MMKMGLRNVTFVLAIALLSNGLGCAFGEVYWDDPRLREYSLQEQSDLYTRLVRFGDVMQASRFVDPEQISEFIESFPDHGKLTFTDYEAGRIEFDDIETRETASIKVTYEGYYRSSPVIMKFVEHQQWYRVGDMNTWRVRSNFNAFEKVASN